MRTIEGRGDWRPANRIESLRRYAFVGDSMVFGSGVAPDKTLPAHAERQINELLPAWPVEAVNLGVCGYNLWNDWHAFKHGPQVYDGLVLTLCGNDSQLLGRTLKARVKLSNEELWQANQPTGQAVAACLDDIAAFSRETSLPIAICYYAVWDTHAHQAINARIRDVCVACGLPFIDIFKHLIERKLPFRDLLASDANHHPSAIAHASVGRHIAARLHRLGWFGQDDSASVTLAPDRILASAKAMVERDRYPPDAALNWAVGVLDIKKRLATRVRALGTDVDFPDAPARDALTASRGHWHAVNRVRSFLRRVTAFGSGIVSSLPILEESRLRLDEVTFALATGNGRSLLGCIVAEERPAASEVQLPGPEDAGNAVGRCLTDLEHLRGLVDGLRRLAASPPLDWADGHFDAIEETGFLSRLLDRVQHQLIGFEAAFDRALHAFIGARAGLPDAIATGCAALLSEELAKIKTGFRFLSSWADDLSGAAEDRTPLFTTVRVTVVGAAIENTPNDGIAVQVEYDIPARLPFRDNDNFLYDGTTATIALRVPVFYAGRVTVFFRVKQDAQTPQVSLVKIDVSNGAHPSCVVNRQSFYADSHGRLVSPRLYPI